MSGEGGRSDPVPIGPVTLSGRLVRLVPLEAGHRDALVAAACADPAEAFPFTWVPRDPASMEAWIAEALAHAAVGRAVPFATLDAATGLVLGSTRFGNVERFSWPDGVERRPPGCADVVEIGWTWLARAAQRTGVNREAKALMLRHAFEAWQVGRVQLKTDVRNLRSRTAIERLGARFEGVLRRHMVAADGGVRDSAMYAITAEDWPAVREALRR